LSVRALHPIYKSLLSLDAPLSTRVGALALLPLLLLLLFPPNWHPNEYGYFMLAFRALEPDAFSSNSAAFDGSNARFVGEVVLGLPVAWFGYETAHLVLKSLMAVIYATALAYFFASLTMTLFEAVIVLAGFALLGQDLMGGEFIFGGVETKTFAYAGVFFALGAIVRGQARLAVGVMALTTYFHFLVGGFWFVAILAFLLLSQRTRRVPIGLAAAYGVLVAPLVAVIVHDQLFAADMGSPRIGPTADYIYSIIRNPHHTAPFLGARSFITAWSNGVVATIALLLSVAFLALRTTDRRSALLTLVAGLLVYLLLALVISYVDRETGFFGKFYLFRPSSLTLFLALTAFVLIARETGASGNGAAKLRTAAVLILAPMFVWQTVKSQVATFATQRYRYPDLVELREFVDRHSAPDAVILVDPDADMTFPGVAMPLLLNRPTLVSYKFVPCLSGYHPHPLYVVCLLGLQARAATGALRRRSG